jgi:hypothetical protein
MVPATTSATIANVGGLLNDSRRNSRPENAGNADNQLSAFPARHSAMNLAVLFSDGAASHRNAKALLDEFGYSALHIGLAAPLWITRLRQTMIV